VVFEELLGCVRVLEDALFARVIDGGYGIAGKKTERRFEKEDARHVE